MNILTTFRYSFVLGSVFFLFACGGGGAPSAKDTVIKGVAQAGVFNSATVKIYGYDAAGTQVQLPTTPAAVTTDSNGSYQANVGSYTGAVVVKVYGTYHDEASAKDITVPEANALQAALPSSAGTMTVSVTPLTDLAVRKALEIGTIKDNITSTNQAISTLFGVADIIAITPVAPTVSALQVKGVTDDQKKYTTALEALSQYVANMSSTPATPTATDLQNALIQISAAISVSGGTPQVTSPQVALNLQQAAVELASNVNTQAVVTAAGSAAQTALVSLSAVGNTTGNKILAVRLKSIGSYSGTIIGTQANITLPPGVTLRTDATTGATLPGAVAASGNAAGSTANGKVSSGVLTVGIISSGFTIGEFATIYCDVPASSTLTAADFTTVTNVKTVDTTGTAISGITMAAF